MFIYNTLNCSAKITPSYGSVDNFWSWVKKGSQSAEFSQTLAYSCGRMLQIGSFIDSRVDVFKEARFKMKLDFPVASLVMLTYIFCGLQMSECSVFIFSLLQTFHFPFRDPESFHTTQEQLLFNYHFFILKK